MHFKNLPRPCSRGLKRGKEREGEREKVCICEEIVGFPKDDGAGLSLTWKEENGFS